MKNKFKIISLFFLIILILLNIGLNAQKNYHVRPNGENYGTGDGSDWDNAFGGFDAINWEIIKPGDALYMAGGLYSGERLYIETSGTEGNPISVKRATVSDHGSDSGWQGNFDALVDIQQTKVKIHDHEHIIFDGIVQYGIRISNGAVDEPFVYYGRLFEVNGRYITIQNVEIIGCGMGQPYGLGGIGYVTTGGAVDMHHVTIRNVNIHEFATGGIKFDGQDHLLIENSKIYNINHKSVPELHTNHLAIFYGNTNVIVRNNYIGNQLIDGRPDGMGLAFSNGSTNIEVYNNVFVNQSKPLWWDYNQTTPPEGYIRIHNNTFYGYRVAIVFGGAPENVPDDFKFADVYNNIFASMCGSSSRQAFGRNQINHDYNLFLEDIYCSGQYEERWPKAYAEEHGIVSDDLGFVNQNNLDLRILESSPAKDKGVNLSALGYNTDFEGNPRPQGQGWDIGAYEYYEGQVLEEETTEDAYILHDIFPNPMTDRAIIPLDVLETGYFKLDVMNVHGQLIRNIQNGELTRGRYDFSWDGKNSNGSKVAKGTYLVTITVGNVRKLGKIVMFK